MNVATYSSDGTAGAERALPETPFDGMVNEDVLHQVVTAVLANRRQGTASTKTRSTVRGGSRKPWRQKGTGRARAGSIRSALWRGGSVVFGPQPRSYRVRVPKRIRRLAIRSALNTRAVHGDLALIEPLGFDPPKTRRIAALLASLGRESENVLLLTEGHKPDVHLSARNLPGVRVLPWGEASAYDILWSDLVLVESSVFDAADDAVDDTAGEGEA
ncbi:50S ribosomal protein L4 [Candidatus Palauibacter sp.]|uniref:50S ribosomal protein L4 n=1 Tax=Candidatus Palauibacter sp. TaxID=3101350 RepID=UPI003B51C04A